MSRPPFLTCLGGLVAAKLLDSWMGSLDYRAAYYDPTVDPAHPGCRRRNIYVFWHETMLTPLYMRGHSNMAVLISQHRDADILDRVALHFGTRTVRGSTYRGGSAAMRELLHRCEENHVGITPDGPRGPRRQLAQGPIYLSSRLGLPLVCLGIGYDRPWRLPSWDRFAVPRPGSRARAIMGPPMQIPAGLDREGVEHYRRRVERMLNVFTEEAEQWAATGNRREAEQPANKGCAATALQRAMYDEQHRLDSIAPRPDRRAAAA